MLILEKLYTDKTDKISNFICSMNNEKFLSWLFNRMTIKYQESNIVINRLKNILAKDKKNTHKTPSPLFIEQMCQKHYPTFNMEKDPDQNKEKIEGLNWGYTIEEKENIRSFIIQLYNDIMEHTT